MTDQIDTHYHMKIAPRAVFEREASAEWQMFAEGMEGDLVMWDPEEPMGDVNILSGDDAEELKERYNEARPDVVRFHELKASGRTPGF